MTGDETAAALGLVLAAAERDARAGEDLLDGPVPAGYDPDVMRAGIAAQRDAIRALAEFAGAVGSVGDAPALALGPGNTPAIVLDRIAGEVLRHPDGSDAGFARLTLAGYPVGSRGTVDADDARSVAVLIAWPALPAVVNTLASVAEQARG